MSDPGDDGTVGTCPRCGRVLGVVNPRGGDGSIGVMRTHKADGVRCKGSHQPAVETPL